MAVSNQGSAVSIWHVIPFLKIYTALTDFSAQTNSLCRKKAQTKSLCYNFNQNLTTQHTSTIINAC